MKKIFSGISVIALIAAALFVFCACDMENNEPAPSGSDLKASPLFTMPVGTAQPDNTANGNTTPTLNGSDTVGGAIKDFVEGTIVDIESVPNIVKAITDKYEKAKVTGITHATHLNEQVYKVTYTDDKGATHTAYVSPDGKTVTDAVEPETSASPAASGTPSEEG